MPLQTGQPAPDFTLRSSAMQNVSLSAHRGKPLLLLFIPLAFSPIWTMEFGIVQSRLNPIRGAGGDVFGISCDSPFALAKWAELRGFTFPLLSDFGKDVSRAYGALYDSLLGLSGVPKRAAFLVDARGTLRHQEISEDAGVMPDLNGFIDRLKTLG